MKQHIMAAVAALAVTWPMTAQAADIPVKAPPAVAATLFTWTGPYVGANGGWQRTDYTSELRGFPGNFVNGNHSSGILGAHFGFNYQYNRLVVGMEFSGSRPLSSYSGWAAGGTPDCLGVNVSGPQFSCRAGLRNLFTLGPRLGFTPVDQWLLFVTGGWAVGNLRDQVRLNANGSISGATSADHNGWFIGGGVEYAVTRNWIVGVEYLHVDFSSRFRCEIPSLGGCNAGESRTGQANTDTVRARLSYKFTTL